MSRSTTPRKEAISTSTLPEQPGVLVAKRHHLLVRWSHWLNVPILLGLILSGISIYWVRRSISTSQIRLLETSMWRRILESGYAPMCPACITTASPPDWIYNHMSLGPGMLALALRLHWLCAYAFMLNGAVYVAGLIAGGGWRGLLPRRTDLLDAFRMFRYYIGFPLAKLARRRWPHPNFNTKYNALQRAAYFSVPLAGCLSVATGWAIHKPMQFHSLAAIFGGFDAARVWHFWLMWVFILFVVPHVILVFADGWDTFRGMIVGWSARVKRPEVTANEQ